MFGSLSLENSEQTDPCPAGEGQQQDRRMAGARALVCERTSAVAASMASGAGRTGGSGFLGRLRRDTALGRCAPMWLAERALSALSLVVVVVLNWCLCVQVRLASSLTLAGPLPRWAAIAYFQHKGPPI